MIALKDALDALRPFANCAGNIPDQAVDGGLLDYEIVSEAFGIVLGCVTHDDLRRVAAAVEAIEKMQEAPPPPAGEMVLVPREALNWLFGEGPDAQGHWFGDGDNPAMSRGRFWWRTNFRNMLAAPLPAQEVGDAMVEQALVILNDQFGGTNRWSAVRTALESALRPGKEGA